MKRHYWQYLIDSAGNAIADAKINVYLAKSLSYAKIFTTESGAVTTTEFTDIITNADGYFDFYMADVSTDAVNGYAYSQRFKVTWSKAGFVSGGLDNLDIIWPFGGEGITSWLQLTDKPSPTITLTGDVSGVGTMVELGNVEIPSVIVNLPGIIDTTFNTTLTVPATATQTFEVADFCERCLVYQIQIVKSVQLGQTYDFYLYRDNSFGASKIQYQLIGADDANTWLDKLPFYLKDEAESSKLYAKIVNNGAAGDFAITINYEKFK